MLLLRLAQENRVTSNSDRRELKNARWVDRPLPLWAQLKNAGHPQADLVASIVEIRRFGDEIWGVGSFSKTAIADTARLHVNDGSLNGVSIDVGDAMFEITDKLDGKVTEDGGSLSDSPFVFNLEDEDFSDWMNDSKEPITVLHNPEIRGATLVGIPAFGKSTIWNYDDIDDVEELFGKVEVKESKPSLTDNVFHIAASSKMSRVETFDKTFFEKMVFDRFTRMTITEDGHVFGHVYRFGDKHRTLPYTFERLGSDFVEKQFMQGQAHVEDSEGVVESVAIGNITYLAPHAKDHTHSMSSAELFEFVQENTGCKMAAVIAWEDSIGLCVSGQLFSDVDGVDASKALAGGWSVDIRRDNNSGRLAPFGVHCVNQMGALAGGVVPDVVGYDGGDIVRLVASCGGFSVGVESLDAIVSDLSVLSAINDFNDL